MPELRELGWLAGAVAAAIGLLGLLIRQIGPWRKQITDVEERLRTELRQELDAERVAHAAERATHAAELKIYILERDEMGDRIAKLEKLLDRQQLRHNAERALDRHRLNNINQCFDALLMLLKANPDKAGEAVVLIEDMRAKQLMAEAEEKAIIRAAEIAADEHEVDHDGN